MRIVAIVLGCASVVVAHASDDIRADALRYEIGSQTERVSGLHRADVDLVAFADALSPVSVPEEVTLETPAGTHVLADTAVVTLETPDGSFPLPVTGTLVIDNTASTWMELAINGTQLGRIGPYGQVVITDVPSGEYEVTQTSPVGYDSTAEVTTQ